MSGDPVNVRDDDLVVRLINGTGCVTGRLIENQTARGDAPEAGLA